MEVLSQSSAGAATMAAIRRVHLLGVSRDQRFLVAGNGFLQLITQGAVSTALEARFFPLPFSRLNQMFKSAALYRRLPTFRHLLSAAYAVGIACRESAGL